MRYEEYILYIHSVKSLIVYFLIGDKLGNKKQGIDMTVDRIFSLCGVFWKEETFNVVNSYVIVQC